MPEPPPDIQKTTGMCPHGNFPDSCDTCITESKPSGERNKMIADLRERVLQKGFTTPEAITEERKQVIEHELDSTGTFMHGFEKPWFVIGGLSVELSAGEITRDHEDIDVAIFADDFPQLKEYATEQGYRFVDWKYDSVPASELDSIEERVILEKTDEKSKGPAEVDVVLLTQDEKGRVEPGTHDISFPPEIHNNPVFYKTKSGQEVPLQPIEVVLLLKLYHGRQKDIEEAGSHLAQLPGDKRQWLDEYVRETGITFEIGDQKINSLDELLKLASEREEADKMTMFDQNVDSLVDEWNKKFDDADEVKKHVEAALRDKMRRMPRWKSKVDKKQQ